LFGDPNLVYSNVAQSADSFDNAYLSVEEVVASYSPNDKDVSTKTTAERLEYCCDMDEIPGDPEVRKDFGFDRCHDFKDRSGIIGLYQGLFHYLKTSAKEVDQWRKEGTLVKNITETYEKVPKDQRGGYYAWFLTHKHIIE
jgi:hypothetical protein